MPELPEVETVRRALSAALKKKTIRKVIVHDARLIKGMTARTFIVRTKHRRIKDVLRKGKALLVELTDGQHIVLHLRISGWILINASGPRYERMTFYLSGTQSLHFCDRRALAEVTVTDNPKALALIRTMGPEPFALNEKAFIERFESRQAKIKTLLMNQKFIAGLGNIYAQEILFCAGIHPGRTAAKITRPERKKLYRCMQRILQRAIQATGTTFDTYRLPSGSSGNYLASLNVYQRLHQKCRRCGQPIRRTVISGRSTYYCSRCQQ